MKVGSMFLCCVNVNFVYDNKARKKPHKRDAAKLLNSSSSYKNDLNNLSDETIWNSAKLVNSSPASPVCRSVFNAESNIRVVRCNNRLSTCTSTVHCKSSSGDCDYYGFLTSTYSQSCFHCGAYFSRTNGWPTVPSSPSCLHHHSSSCCGHETSNPSQCLHGASSANELKELLRQSWYQPGLPRNVALDLLAEKDVGSFLVRDSNSHPGCYALSVRVPKFDNSSGIAHYLIERNRYTGAVRLKGLDKEWPSLQALVIHHTFMPEMLSCVLRLPNSSRNPSFKDSDKEDLFLCPAIEDSAENQEGKVVELPHTPYEKLADFSSQQNLANEQKQKAVRS